MRHSFTGLLACRYDGNTGDNFTMEQDRTWNLFALKLAGKATPEEWAELQQLIEGRPEIALHLQALTNFWHQHSKYDKERIEKAMNKIAAGFSVEKEATVPGTARYKPVQDRARTAGSGSENQKWFMTRVKKIWKNYLTRLINRITHKTGSPAG